MPQNTYEFFYGKPGLFLEIYLTKKAQFQGLLFDVLTKGSDLPVVRAHFRSRKAGDIRRFLPRNQDLREFSAADIRNFQEVFFGYSLYEVDGTFKGEVQERTQIVRVIFVPDIDSLATGLRIPHDRRLFYARQYLRFWTHDAGDYINFRQCTIPFAPGEWELVQKLSRWLYYVGLFANGYLLYEICAGIRSLYETHAIARPEREIWVTSFRDLALNQIKLVTPGRKIPRSRPRTSRSKT